MKVVQNLFVLFIALSSILVLPNANAAPLDFVSTPETNVLLHDIYTYQPELTLGYDGARYSLTTKPKGATIDARTGLVTWDTLGIVPTAYNFEIKVAKKGSKVLQSFSLNVESFGPTSTEFYPVITAVPRIEVQPGELYQHQIVAYDPDGYSLRYEIKNGPNSMTISNTGLVSWVPKNGELGVQTISVRVYDLGGVGSDVIFYIHVHKNPNSAPIAISESITAVEETNVLFTLSSSDADKDYIDHYIKTEPLHGTLTLNGQGDASYTPELNYFGIDSFTWAATDYLAESNIATTTINITNSKDFPVLTPVDVTTLENTAVEIKLEAISIDKQPLAYYVTASTTNGLLSGVGTDTLVYQPNQDFFGIDRFTWAVSDDNGATLQSSTVNITIEELKIIVTSPENITVEATDVLTHVEIGQATAVDSNGSAFIANADNLGPYPLGETNIVWSAQDLNGFTGTDEQIITVEDTVAPELILPDHIAIQVTEASVVSLGSANAIDIFSVNIINDAPSIFPLGTTFVEWKATDTSGNFITDIQVVHLQTNEVGPDSDQDGLPDSVDAFPQDPTEYLDLDGDGIGNNADQDDDGDFFSDEMEIEYGSNPLDPNSKPTAEQLYTGSKLPQTGETTVYAANDDASLKAGIARSYQRDIDTQVVKDMVHGQSWVDGAEAKNLQMSWSDANLYCRDLVYGGNSSWRLPSLKELSYLLDHDRINKTQGDGLIDNIFENIFKPSTATGRSAYWTSKNSLAVDFTDGDLVSTSSSSNVRCVNGGDSSEARFRYGIIGNNVTLDIDNDLMWQDDVSVITNKQTWEGALNYCDNLTLAGASDWRLPNTNESYSIVNEISSQTTVTSQFKNQHLSTGGNTYWWSSSTYMNTGEARTFFAQPSSYFKSHHSKDTEQFVRCVRDFGLPTIIVKKEHRITYRDTVVLDATNSFTYPGTQVVSYFWSDTTEHEVLGTSAVIQKSDFTPGAHIIYLSVTDEFGFQSSTNINVIVESKINEPPIAIAEINRDLDYVKTITIEYGEQVAFWGYESSDVEGAISTYLWKDGDTVLSTSGKFTTTTALSIGLHNVILTVTDSEGLTDTDSVTINVVAPATTAPIANAGADLVFEIGSTVVLDGGQSSDDGQIVSYEWTDTYQGDTTILSTDVSFSYTPIYGGSYSIRLTVTDNTGLSSFDDVMITTFSVPEARITPKNPGVEIAYLEYGENLYLDGSSSVDRLGSELSYEWFDNGFTISNSSILSVTNLTVGDHLIKLKVTNLEGYSSNVSTNVSILRASLGYQTCRLKAPLDESVFVINHPEENINYAGYNFSDVEQIERAFNNARRIDTTITQYLKLPSQIIWDEMNVQEKGLYLVNAERSARGIRPFEGTTKNVIDVADNFANYLLTSGVDFGHYHADGTGPAFRLDQDSVIKNNRDNYGALENNVGFPLHASGEVYKKTLDEYIVKSIYTLIYWDKFPYGGTPAWGHRDSMLQHGIMIENSGEIGKEGLIGFGFASGLYDNQYFPNAASATMMVMNIIDPNTLTPYTNVQTVDISNAHQCNDQVDIELDSTATEPSNLRSLNIIQTNLIIGVSQTSSLTVIGKYKDGTEDDITHLVDFIPDVRSVVSIERGIVTGLNLGNVGITVSKGGISSNRVIIKVVEPINTDNLIGTDVETYIPFIPPNASFVSNPKILARATGKIEDLFNVGIEGVRVSVLGKEEYGSVTSNANGQFYITLPAGQHKFVFSKYNYLSVQKNVSLASNQWAVVDTVNLQTQDTKTTLIDLSNNSVQVHQSTEFTDERGSRSASVVFSNITSATVIAEDGSQRQMSRLNVSATEFTTPETMPGPLPETSSFTYCVDIKVEGVADNESITFDKDVVLYVDNFLDFAIGEIVPVGYYDRVKGTWIGSQNGVIVETLDTNSDGLVDGVDYTGDGVADDINADGSTLDEIVGIESYPVGKTYMRASFNHFTSLDLNWFASLELTEDEQRKILEAFTYTKEQVDAIMEKLRCTNSYVNTETRSFQEDIAITGSNIKIHYDSKKVTGYKHEITIQLVDDTVSDRVREIKLEIEIAGVKHKIDFLPELNLEHTFIWDGLDVLGNIVTGEVKGIVRIGHVYPTNYSSNGNAATSGETLSSFEQAWAIAGTNITLIEGREEAILWTTQPLEFYSAPKSEIANGWSLSNHHELTSSGKIYKGDGTVDDAIQPTIILKTDMKESVFVGDDGTYQKGGSEIDYEILKGNILNDKVTGLMWQYENPLSFPSYVEAENYCIDLIIGENNNWRLPTTKETTYSLSKGNLLQEIEVFNINSGRRWNTSTVLLEDDTLTELPVYCVSGEKLDDLFVKDLIRNDIEETVTDIENGLMWQDDPSVLSNQGSWQSAITQCETLDYVGFTDWRLPNVNELMYALPNTKFSYQYTFSSSTGYWTYLDPNAHPYWTSTPNILNLEQAWAIESYGANSKHFPHTTENYVRCVRDDLSLVKSPYIFDNSGKHLKTVDINSGITLTTFTYDEETEKLIAVSDQFGNTLTINRTDGIATSIESPDGYITDLDVVSNDLKTVTYADGSNFQFDYQDSLMTTETDQVGNVYTHEFDQYGRVLNTTDPEGGLWSFNYERDSINKKRTYGMSTIEGRQDQIEHYDVIDGVIRQVATNNEGTIKEVLVNDEAQTTQIKQRGTNITYTEVDDVKTKETYQSQSTLTLPSGLVSTTQTTRVYGDNNANFKQRTTTQIINNKTETLEEDFELGRIVRTSPESIGYTIQYDPQTNLLTELTVPGSHGVAMQYDTRGRINTVNIGDRNTLFSYNDNLKGELSSITDALGRSTQYSYDVLGRLLTETNPQGKETNYTYDNNGNVSSITPPGKTEHVFNYNGVNKESSYTPPDVSTINTPTTTYNYNRDRELIEVIRPDQQSIGLNYNSKGQLSTMSMDRGDYTFGYDTQTGAVTQITAPTNETLAYDYDAILNIGTTWSGTVTGSVTKSYNNDLVVTNRTVSGGQSINYLRNNDLQLTQSGDIAIQRQSNNGYISGTSINSLSTNQSYNAYAELNDYNASYDGNALISQQYQHDLLGRITQKVETLNAVTTTYGYSYNNVEQLETVTTNGIQTAIYTYDSNGNRTHVNGGILGSHDAQDRMIQYGATQYSYTDNGELQQKHNSQSNETTNYNYDILGNLTQVTLPDATIIDYVIDGQNRRIGKKVNGTLIQGLLYKDQLNPIAELDGNNNVISQFIYATKGNIPDYMIKGGQTYRIISDHLGSPRLVVNTNDGSIVQTMQYDTWGNIQSDSNPGFQPFGFAGGIYDQHTKLTRFGARDYDAQTARWTAKDPIRFAGGDSNLYGYVANDPINFFDPDGEKSVKRKVYDFIVQSAVVVASFFSNGDGKGIKGVRIDKINEQRARIEKFNNVNKKNNKQDGSTSLDFLFAVLTPILTALTPSELANSDLIKGEKPFDFNPTGCP